ncbi:hypothetical protein RCL_jg29695.t1 [Rhizophagus clarus]|uniref:Uncharacterized protein n=1 Tax=Rhizophagus clarus TaxID=94130 RepID=A0A8H3L2P7_9GLOM|nr:hypothetical protein RCL_jg29695.t1 [Rhizophagus clarus]
MQKTLAFFKILRNFSVSSINNQIKKETIKPSQNPNTKGPHPVAILAVLSIGVSAYVSLVRHRENKS